MKSNGSSTNYRNTTRLLSARPATAFFRVGDQRFMVNTHNPGSKQVKSYSVDDFIDAMIELGWYED
jgi:hypothetical protein